MMWQKANGIDNSPLIPYHEKKSISTERTFMKDTIDTRKLQDFVTAMVEQLAYELRHSQKVCSNISIKLRYSDFQTVSKQKSIPYTAADHTLISHAKGLFNSVYSRRVHIRLVGVRLGDLAGGGHQIDLFNDDDRIIDLYHAMDKIKTRYGANAVRRSVAMEVNGLGRGNPFSGEPTVVPAHRNA